MVNKLIVTLLFLSAITFSCKEEIVFYDTLNETNVYSGTSELIKIDFVNNQLGFAVGNNGAVLKTNNGGNTWSAINGFDANINFNSLSLVEDSIIYISGRSDTRNNKALYKSVDYGKSWESLTVSNINGLEQTCFVSNSIGYSVSSGTIFKTHNGGISFQRILSTDHLGTQRIYFLDTLRGLAYTDDYGVIPTMDGGDTWGDASGVSLGNNVDFYYVNDFDMTSSGIGVAVDQGGSVFLTSNYGVDWYTDINYNDLNPHPDNMVDVALLTVQIIDNTIITSGPHTIAFSDDMGVSWKTYYDQEVRSIYYRDLYFFDKKNGVGIRDNSIFKINKVD